jgi:hypothetical protein
VKQFIAAFAGLALLVLGGWWLGGQRGDRSIAKKVDACILAQEQVSQRRATRGHAPAGEPSDAAVVARACAPLYGDAACRGAMMHFDDPPIEARSRTEFETCTKAYCPTLPAPRPAACEHPSAEPSELVAQWNELRELILRREIGQEQAARVFHDIP